jgi:hypothetical protein
MRSVPTPAFTALAAATVRAASRVALVFSLAAALACGDDEQKAPSEDPVAVTCENPALVKLSESALPHVDHWLVQGDMLYAASDAAADRVFRVLDMSDPNSIRELGSLEIEYGGPLLEVGGYVYLAGGLSGLQIIDVSDPAAPALATTFELPLDLPFDVWRQGDVVGVSSLDAIHLLNVDDPLRPAVLGSVTLGDVYESPAVAGDRLYALSDPLAGDTPALRIVDISNRQAPRPVTSVLLPDTSYSTPVLTGGYAYLAGQRALSAGSRPILQILELSDPDVPKPAGEIELTRSSELLLHEGRLYTVSDRGVRVFDLEQPTEPKEVAHYANALLQPYFEIFGDTGYALVEDGLRQLDLKIQCPAVTPP